jgi:glutamine synthetase
LRSLVASAERPHRRRRIPTGRISHLKALDAFDAGRVLPKYLGERYHKLYATCRREECDRIHSEIPDRDYEWYLRAV